MLLANHAHERGIHAKQVVHNLGADKRDRECWYELRIQRAGNGVRDQHSSSRVDESKWPNAL